MRKKAIKNITSDLERAFYGSKDIIFKNICVSGPLDGESAFKESSNIIVHNSSFNLRYPFWHNLNTKIYDSIFYKTSRAPFWYDHHLKLENVKILSVKPLRESTYMKVNDCIIKSIEPFWKCNHIVINNSRIEGQYAFFESKNIVINNLRFKGKYSFQYIKNMKIYDSFIDTKDAFWHSNDITVYNSTIKGQYLGWYSKNLTLINCIIEGTQPLCYCTNLQLVNCQMINTDLAFEYSIVDATIKGSILSIKNPYKGRIEADEIKDIILDDNRKKDMDVAIKDKYGNR